MNEIPQADWDITRYGENYPLPVYSYDKSYTICLSADEYHSYVLIAQANEVGSCTRNSSHYQNGRIPNMV